MRKRNSLNNYFSRDRKILYMILGIVMISVLTLTVVYATLSTTLNINGNAEVSSASWDVHLDNVHLNSNSATTTPPTITNSTTTAFSTTLSKPGDFYEFTIDVVNDGTIDAMIDGVTKTPTLTTAQAKYLNYIVEYQNGEPINNKQIVSKGSFVRLKVKLEFRKDITASDLPSTSETLNLSFKVNYVQSDETGTNVTDNGKVKAYRIVSGDLETVGSEICIGEECFYVISSDEDSVTMLAKYNLEVGNVCTSETSCTPIENPSGKQSEIAKGVLLDLLADFVERIYPWYGIIKFSSEYYWWNVDIDDFKTGFPIDDENDYLRYVYDNNSLLYEPIENYKAYLESKGANIEEARLIKASELTNLGCSVLDFNEDCRNAPSWVYSTNYWSGTAYDYDVILTVETDGEISRYFSLDATLDSFGVRPVIVIAK